MGVSSLQQVEQDVAEQLRAARADGAAVDACGQGTLAGLLPQGAAAGEHAPYRLDLTGNTGIVHYEPADLTVTVRANTPVAELDVLLAAHGQECALDVWGTPRGSGTVAGRVAAGLGGRRMLGRGSVRDVVLGIRFVGADGVAASAGGATVKNVTGYDVVRLLVGSWGTLAVFTEVTLKLAPVPDSTGWFTGEAGVIDLGALYWPSAIVQVGEQVHVLLEGDAADCAAQAAAARLAPGEAPEVRSAVRVSAPPPLVREWLAVPDAAVETRLGVAHLPDASGVEAVRARAEAAGGRALVLDPAAGVDAFGSGGRTPYDARLKEALDPDGTLAPWRRP